MTVISAALLGDFKGVSLGLYYINKAVISVTQLVLIKLVNLVMSHKEELCCSIVHTKILIANYVWRFSDMLKCS